jgi:hypothetical protein
MARIRSIKAEFFTSADVLALTPLARLLYIGLWCEADREGRLKWTPLSFRYRYLPADDCDIDAVAGELVDRGLVVRYGDNLAYIPSFLKHQRPNPREQDSAFPDPALRENPDSHRENLDLHSQGGRERNGRERKGMGVEGACPDTHTPTPIVPKDAWLSLVDCWNTVACRVSTWHTVKSDNVHPRSQARLRAAIKAAPDLNVWDARFERAARSSWLTGQKAGRDGETFKADLWWVCEHADELDSGRYDDREVIAKADPRVSEQDAMWQRVLAGGRA